MDDQVLTPLADLLPRYSDKEGNPISRNALMLRVDRLGIQPTKIGRSVFFTEADVNVLDKLHEHLKWGGTIKDFGAVDSSGITPVQSSGLAKSSSAGLVNSPSGLDAMVIMGDVLAKITRPDAAQAFVNRMEALEKAAEKGWLIPSGELCQILSISRPPGGDEFSRYGFTFSRGMKQGREALWSVTKLN